MTRVFTVSVRRERQVPLSEHGMSMCFAAYYNTLCVRSTQKQWGEGPSIIIDIFRETIFSRYWVGGYGWTCFVLKSIERVQDHENCSFTRHMPMFCFRSGESGRVG